MLTKILLPYKSQIKVGLIGLFFIGIVFAYFQVQSMYDSAIKEAKEAGAQQAELEYKNRLLKLREETEAEIASQRLENIVERERLEAQIQNLRARAREAERKLLLDTEFDIMLQARPDFVLEIVQETTIEQLNKLEEITK